MERRNFIKSIMATSAAVVTVPTMVFAENNKTAENNETKVEVKKVTVKGPNDLPYEDAVKAIVGDKELKDSDKVKLTVPEIAENGAVVPVKVAVESPMTEKEHVKSIHILNTKNANSRCADIMLTTKNAEAKFASRVKLSESQDVVAIVAFSDGTFMKAGKSVKVTIGGCG
ncbi:MAG: Sulfur oxidation protein SoxY [uncultured Sulfurovum sp.]|uniref:Sulfur oxidation protein SoxY n=1 Tax=uncultured Sulfurovum sp. TaxID=269237 RepID=A0A6S6TDB3_9BACT|nr:MAG: Sulfur oxidation protein SoxY [uncultured Sulfurovum sp.]